MVGAATPVKGSRHVTVKQTINFPKSDTLAVGLETYQSKRKSRAARVVDAASANARNYHLKFPPVRWAAHTGLRMIGAMAPNKMLDRFDWLYREDVTQS